MLVKPIEVKALDDYRIWLKYADGVDGEVDLSNLAGKGVFSKWNNYSEFQKVHVGSHGAITWCDEIDLCPDSIYLKLTGKAPQDLFPALHPKPIDA